MTAAMECPLCHSGDSALVKRLEVETLVRRWATDFQIDIFSEFQGQTTIELRRCHNCELFYFLPNTLAGSPALYAALQKFDWYYMPRKWEHDVALKDLEGCENGVEIGCGFGDFVARVASEKKIHFEGCEQNPSAVEIARRNGISVILETSENLAKSRTGDYSAVCSFQVLEHLADPAGFLDAACALLRPGGKLMLGLPNARSFLRYQFNPLDMPPHHMTRWTVAVLSRVQRFFPLKLMRIAIEPLADYHVDGYVEAYTDVLARRGLSIFAIPAVRSRVARAIRKSGINRFLRGQSIYACYARV